MEEIRAALAPTVELGLIATVAVVGGLAVLAALVAAHHSLAAAAGRVNELWHGGQRELAALEAIRSFATPTAFPAWPGDVDRARQELAWKAMMLDAIGSVVGGRQADAACAVDEAARLVAEQGAIIRDPGGAGSAGAAARWREANVGLAQIESRAGRLLGAACRTALDERQVRRVAPWTLVRAARKPDDPSELVRAVGGPPPADPSELLRPGEGRATKSRSDT
jgi:hypothetical protein